MSDEPQAAENEATEEVPPVMRALAVVMFALPLLGILLHAFIYAAKPAWSDAYLHGNVFYVVAMASCANIFGNWFHFRHTRMTLDIFSRILTYLCLISLFALRIYWLPR
ncbi:MAG: hypothetical protein NT049_03125 [Planctomycetota bacterium]|nr:hypothetical protein [Planctomycetota bacterium]